MNKKRQYYYVYNNECYILIDNRKAKNIKTGKVETIELKWVNA